LRSKIVAKKKTKTMYVRDVPLDVWERVNKICREKDLKLRNFIEQAVSLFEGNEDQENPDQEEKNPLDEFNIETAKIKGQLKLFKEIIDLKKKIIGTVKNLELIEDEEKEISIFLELRQMWAHLDEMMKKYVPKHEIPDDLETRRKMNLPERYWNKPILISRKQVEKRKREATSSKTTSEVESDSWSEAEAVVEEWKKKYRESNKQNDETPAEKKAVKKEQVSRDSEIDKARLKKKIERAHKRWEKMERKKGKGSSKRERPISKKEIATEDFSRGPEELDEEE
jgi:hypothetical protein